ncbi:MAG: phosphate ABC transporter permease subunit PstC [Blastocatellia bacterium]|nr:phosphate ABC transporter permease subunit PstC [Blastocatellia bacterium]
MEQRILTDKAFYWVFRAAAMLSILILLGIFLMLVIKGAGTFREVGIGEFLLGTIWNPSAYGDEKYGILSLIAGTLLVTLIAMLIAAPLGIGTAAFLSEFAPKKLAAILKPIIEMLAAVPSVAVGFIGIIFVGPLIASTFGLNNGLNALNGAILLAVMSLPTVITVAEDAIRAVPESYKEASYAVGANRWETLVKVTLPAATSGIIAALMLGVGRAVGETMTVLMATGNATAMPYSIFDSVRTMTATIAIELGEVPFQTIHYHSLFAVGAVLFLITLSVNLVAEWVAAGYRQNGQ